MACLVKKTRRTEEKSRKKSVCTGEARNNPRGFWKMEQRRSLDFDSNTTISYLSKTFSLATRFPTSLIRLHLHTRSRGAKTRSCSSPRCDELGCSARYSAFLLSRPFQYLTVRPRGRPFSTCFLLPPSSSLLSVRRPPYTRSYAIHPLSVPPPLFVPPLPRRVPSPCCAPGCTSTPVETTERHKQPI